MNDECRQWIIMSPLDDVATALFPLRKGTEVIDKEHGFYVQLTDDIPFGHKFAIREIQEGALVHKYGQVIGIATALIRAGEHVHVHNVDSRRGRGDLVKERFE